MIMLISAPECCSFLCLIYHETKNDTSWLCILWCPLHNTNQSLQSPKHKTRCQIANEVVNMSKQQLWQITSLFLSFLTEFKPKGIQKAGTLIYRTWKLMEKWMMMNGMQLFLEEYDELYFIHDQITSYSIWRKWGRYTDGKKLIIEGVKCILSLHYFQAWSTEN